jgi:hypothetical protein
MASPSVGLRADRAVREPLPNGPRATTTAIVSPCAEPAPILLFSVLFPPAIGGSAVLFENIYSRLAGVQVRVLTDEVVSRADDDRRGNLEIVWRAILAVKSALMKALRQETLQGWP